MKTVVENPSHTETVSLPTYFTPPPANLVIPQPPAGWETSNAADYRGVKPKQLELRTLVAAVSELAKFSDYEATLGKTAPPYAQVLPLFDAASKWSMMRSAAAAWDTYCAVQEGIIWTQVRDHMARIKPAMALALRSDSSIAGKYVNFVTLLGARTTIARKGASTRRANKISELKGELPTHGVVGKQRKRAADKAAVAKATEILESAAHAVTSTPKADAPAAASPQPVVPPASQLVAPSAQPAVNAAPLNGASVNGANGANGSNGSNGAAHA